MANFFELLGFDSNDMADAMPEKIVQAFHDKGKEGVRVLMYEEMAKRLQCPLHIHIGNEDGTVSSTSDVYGAEMPGEPIKLVREPTDLYRKYGESGGGSSPNRDSPEAPQPRKRGGGGGGGKNTGPDAWEKRFADLAEFVAKNGFRPRRTAPTDAERHLHYWMGQQQRKLGHNELPRDQADKLEALLQATKGKKADSARKAGGGGGGGGRSRAASQGDMDGGDEGAGEAYGDDGDE